MVDWSPRANVKTVLFLCTGNYYRSRFAEELFNYEAERASLPWIAQSRGLALEAPGEIRTPDPQIRSFVQTFFSSHWPDDILPVVAN
jgi:protein-tyrosine-phosphatase